MFFSSDDSQEFLKTVGKVLLLAGLTYVVPTGNTGDWMICLVRLFVSASWLYASGILESKNVKIPVDKTVILQSF